jgi:biotin carboxyl carrier protein
MKMETTVVANEEGKIKRIHLKEGTFVYQDDLVVVFE